MNEEHDGQYYYEEENGSADEAIEDESAEDQENTNMVSEWLIGSWNIKRHLSDDKTMPDSNFHDLDKMTSFKLYMIALMHFECIVNK